MVTVAKRRTREELLREFDEWYTERPRWLESLTNEGIQFHIDRARGGPENPHAAQAEGDQILGASE
jgi:hypothetical protein